MKRALLFILPAMLIIGCSGRAVNQPEISDISQSTSQSVSGEAEAPEQTDGSSEEQSSASYTTETESEENSVLYLWKKDVTLQDPWVPTQELSSFPYKEITVPASEAVPIEITSESVDLKSDQIDSALGEVRSSYDLVNAEESVKEAYPKIWTDLKKYNEFAQQNAIDEITEGETRFKAYSEENPGSPLSLISATGIEIKRADSGILSYFRTVHRNNLGIEPDYYEIYGKTIDASSGRVLTLNDILADTDGLGQMIWDGLVRSGCRADSDPDKEAVIELLDKAIQGCRDDGSFGWALDQEGIEFDMIVSYINEESINEEYVNEENLNEEKTVHSREHAYVPFSMCGDTLRPGVAVETPPESEGE